MREGRRERTDGEWWRDGLGVVCILETQQDAVMDRKTEPRRIKTGHRLHLKNTHKQTLCQVI